MKKIILAALCISFMGTQASIACTVDGSEGIVPENNLYISTNAKNVSMDEQTFHEVIDKVVAVYDPIIKEKGGELNVLRNWEDGTVNAYAHRRGGTWNVAMFGGLARHETITPDGFALVVCHEIGHHIGGAPKKASLWSSWATNEGQADYFATLKCLRKVFRNDNNKSIVSKMDVPQVVIDTCEKQFNNTDDQLICQRGAMAGMSTARLFQDLRSQTEAPKFNTPDENVVSRTDHNHPATQCRLDTYYAGAICEVIDNDDVSQRDETKGVCYRAFGVETGARPKCWFAPKKD